MEQIAKTIQPVSANNHKQSFITDGLVVLISFVWLGFFSAISFMEAPVKFQAPHLSLSIGVEVGRVVFQTSQMVQWMFFLLLLLSLLRAGKLFSTLWIGWVGLMLIMLAESCWLFPVLDRQAQQVIQGHVLPMTTIHWVFVGTELLKIPCLLFLGWKTMKIFSVSSKYMVSH
ncbi:hypothetical protein [Thermoflavifilum thermophilum]|uniref:DUF4149 domain-containing protein n=1 Tax=Thermoflavifilum thermophilum TaxID=1393122 RepID=A0A1I7MYX9_9BACT|nr:hypothetical protein [Thermoflavifilum thermophilum]SFV27633.1 hypothetical protein SAMN05660895_0154 [Thermoflavifilum thermophilum]